MPPSWWHPWQLAWRILTTSLLNVTAGASGSRGGSTLGRRAGAPDSTDWASRIPAQTRHAAPIPYGKVRRNDRGITTPSYSSRYPGPGHPAREMGGGEGPQDSAAEGPGGTVSRRPECSR